MPVMWSEELETGNERIDFQHKQLIEIYGVLLDVFSKGEGHITLVSALKFLNDYTVKHFFDEEELQLQYNYPDYEKHKKLHASFKLTVAGLSTQLSENGISEELVASLNSKIGAWLMNHIMREDIKIAQFINQKTCV